MLLQRECLKWSIGVCLKITFLINLGSNINLDYIIELLYLNPKTMELKIDLHTINIYYKVNN